jgi:UDP-N-acetylmuramate--alanine ligase
MLLTADTPSRGQYTTLRASLPERIHLLGACGAGMQSLARLLIERGHRVTGSDAKPQAVASTVRRGLRITKDDDVGALPKDAQLIVASDAVPHEAPQLEAARHLGIPKRSYAETLGVLMRERVGIAVAGTHGKSSTAAMLAEILLAARLDPTVVVGATSLDGDPVARYGRGPHMIAEACEYRANFLNLSPSVAAVLNVEADHFDCYTSPEQLDAAFAAFMRRVPSHGQLVMNSRCSRTIRLAEGMGCEIITFGHSDSRNDADTADWQASEVELRSGYATMNLVHRGRSIGAVRLRVPGRHQVDNALAAAALAACVGVQAGAIVSGLQTFRGLRRRLEWLGEFGGVQFIDDYAHHPTEVAAALASVRSMFPRRRVWCVFQPHQASRTAHLLDDFAAALASANQLAIADIFRAREGAPSPNEITAADLARQTATHGVDILQVHATNDILKHVESAVRPGDVVVTLGAGDIGNLAHALIDRLRTHRAAG